MARYIGMVRGQSGNTVTRLGSPRSGIETVAQGGNLGVRVMGEPQHPTTDPRERDVFYVYATSGTNGRYGSKLIGTLRQDETTGAPVFTVAT